jgi:8-oxo-dGTP pyrophosphatase MutT (NUDIX family)
MSRGFVRSFDDRTGRPAISVVLLCMETRVIADEVRLSEEHDDLAWVPLADLPRWDILESMEPVARDYADRNRAP